MKNIIRSVKYFLLLVAIFAILNLYKCATSSVEISFEEQLAFFFAQKGALKLALVFVISLLYPYFGFVKRSIAGSILENRDQIEVAMELKGFSFKEERDNVLYFKANTILRKIAFLGEDTIEVKQIDGNIVIEGVRKSVVYIAYYLEGFIENSKRGE